MNVFLTGATGFIGSAIVPELMQSQMTGERLAAEALGLLRDDAARARMRAASVPISRISRNQVKPCACSRIAAELPASGQPPGFKLRTAP